MKCQPILTFLVTILFGICGSLGVTQGLCAQELTVSSLQYGTPYRLVKPAVASAFASGTVEERMHAVLKAAETAYGSRARQALGGSELTLARTPGGEGLAKRFGVANRSTRKGALRAARVATAMDRDSRFKLLALDEPVRDKWGNLRTDRDIAYRHRATGIRGRIEVKDVTERSQYSSQRKYKRQIDLMADEQRRTGQPQSFVNRRAVIASLKEYASKQGIMVFENVVTSPGTSNTPNTVPIEDVLDRLDQASLEKQRAQRLGVSFGIAFAIAEGVQSVRNWNAYVNGHGTRLQACYTSALAGASASFVAKSASSQMLLRVNPSSTTARLLGGTSRVAGILGVAFTGSAVVIRAAQWKYGQISTRQLVTESAGTAGGLAGGVAGAWAIGGFGTVLGGQLGALAGAPFAGVGAAPGAAAGSAIGGVIGMIAGGIGGAWAGEKISMYGIESYYSRLDEAQQRELFAQLKSYYTSQAKTAQ